MKNFFMAISACMVLCCSITACAADKSGSSRTAAEFTLKSLTGTTYQLSAYRDKQPVLLFFWTTWCPYCLTKLQLMNTEYAGLEKKGLALLAINAGERRTSVERLVRNYGIKYTVLLDESSAATDAFRIVGVPTFILIDTKGVIRFKGNDYPQAEIQEVLGRQ
jgi:peroxiredoxin